MTIEIKDEQGVRVASIKGRLDSATATEAQVSLLQKLGEPDLLVILELSGLDYVSSAGLRTILAVAKKVQANHGKVVAAAMQEQVKEIFEIAGFDRIIPSYADVALAIAGLKG